MCIRIIAEHNNYITISQHSITLVATGLIKTGNVGWRGSPRSLANNFVEHTLTDNYHVNWSPRLLLLTE